MSASFRLVSDARVKADFEKALKSTPSGGHITVHLDGGDDLHFMNISSCKTAVCEWIVFTGGKDVEDLDIGGFIELDDAGLEYFVIHKNARMGFHWSEVSAITYQKVRE